MRVAIVHYWLLSMRGGEKVVEALCELFPDADVFTHVYDPNGVSEVIRKHSVRTTFIEQLPWAKRLYQAYLPLMPMALEQLDLSGYDLVISSESGPAKGVIVPASTTHICYCHTPMRYLWEMYHEYRRNAGMVTRWMMGPMAHYLRLWDVVAASRVDHFIANSEHVAGSIRRYYRRSSEVIPPPVDVDAFTPSNDRGDFYLFLGQLVDYKRADLAVEAFNEMGEKLVVIGNGKNLRTLRRLAGSTVTVLGWQPAHVVKDYYSRCRALVFPGREDFGIVPVEAMASGRPVIAYARGGATETVVDGVTGVLFAKQTAGGLIEAVRRFEREESNFVVQRIVEHARRFDRRRFKEAMRAAIDRALGEGARSSTAR